MWHYGRNGVDGVDGTYSRRPSVPARPKRRRGEREEERQGLVLLVVVGDDEAHAIYSLVFLRRPLGSFFFLRFRSLECCGRAVLTAFFAPVIFTLHLDWTPVAVVFQTQTGPAGPRPTRTRETRSSNCGGTGPVRMDEQQQQ